MTDLPKPIKFIYDYASPYAYIAHETMAVRLPGMNICPVPMYLRATDRFGTAIPFSPAQLRNIHADIHRIADHEGIPLIVPDSFPINGLHGLRGALALQDRAEFAEYHRRVFRAAWAENRDISQPEIIVDIATEAGCDRQDFSQRISSAPIKERLKEQSTELIESGIFGVPSFIVGDEIFWGQDRMDYVFRAASANQARRVR